MLWIVKVFKKENKKNMTTEWAVYKGSLYCILLEIMIICDKVDYVPISLEWSALRGGISHLFLSAFDITFW